VEVADPSWMTPVLRDTVAVFAVTAVAVGTVGVFTFPKPTSRELLAGSGKPPPRRATSGVVSLKPRMMIAEHQRAGRYDGPETATYPQSSTRPGRPGRLDGSLLSVGENSSPVALLDSDTAQGPAR
jgi:hypothetical protein